MNAEANDFAQFVEACERTLERTAWLLTGDWGLAEDLARSWPRWERINRRDHPEVYVRRVMVNTWTTWSRRRWRGERASPAAAEAAAAGDVAAEVAMRLALRGVLKTLTGRQRAVRYRPAPAPGDRCSGPAPVGPAPGEGGRWRSCGCRCSGGPGRDCRCSGMGAAPGPAARHRRAVPPTVYVAYQSPPRAKFVGPVVPISTATNTPGKPIRLGTFGPMAITPDGKTIYISAGLESIPISTATNTPGKPIRARYGIPVGIVITH